MFTVTNKGRVMLVCDCCKLEFPGGDSIPEVRQRALGQGWIKIVAGNYYCAPCAIGMRQK
jgi:hypothetical protein